MKRLLQVSAALTLLGLALMVWSMVVPTPLPVILAMSLGQLLGTLAFGMFGYAVLVDQLRKQRAKGAMAAAARRAAAAAASSSGAGPSAGASGAGPSVGSSTAASAASASPALATTPAREAPP